MEIDKSEIIRIGNLAVKKAQQESLKNGVANVYSKNGKIYFQLPNGKITEDIPKEYKNISQNI